MQKVQSEKTMIIYWAQQQLYYYTNYCQWNKPNAVFPYTIYTTIY